MFTRRTLCDMARSSILLWIFSLLVSKNAFSAKCVLPKLGYFDCGDGNCISNDLICNGKIDCTATNKDEIDCSDHFRRRCLINKNDFVMDLDNFTNVYLGYNVIFGLAGPVLDWRYVDAHVHNEGDCRRPSSESGDIRNSGKLFPLLPYNIDGFMYRKNKWKTGEFQSAVFDSPYEAFLDLKKRKSVVIRSDTSFDDLHTVTLPHAYQQIVTDHKQSYWIDEQTFWQNNSPIIRLYQETVIGEFRLRPNYRLALNPEFQVDLDNAILDNNTLDENDTWWRVFDRHGTHFPIGGKIGGSIEIIARRKNCPKNNNSTGNGHAISMAEIEKCLMAKLQDNDEEEKWHCGKLVKRSAVQSISDAIDWTYRKVIGGDETILGPSDQLPSSGTVDNWTKSVPQNPRALSTELTALCDLIDRFLLEGDRNEQRDEEIVRQAKLSCQRALVSYVKERDVLHVPVPKMIPCRADAVAVWRFQNRNMVLSGLPWCFSTTNTDGSCPATAVSPRTLRAALSEKSQRLTNSAGSKLIVTKGNQFILLIALAAMAALHRRWFLKQ